MRIRFLVLIIALFPFQLRAQSIATKTELPGTRNTTVVYYDDKFLFLARNYGDHRDFHGPTVPGFFVHSKSHGLWLQLTEVSTKDARFGKSQSDNPEENKRLKMATVNLDLSAFQNMEKIALPLKSPNAIIFPDKIEFDATGDRYQLSFFTSWKVESAVTILYVNRKDLLEQFDKARKP